MSLGLMVAGKKERAYNEQEALALREILDRVRSAHPQPAGPPAPLPGMRFAELDSGSLAFIADISNRVSFTLDDRGRVADVEITQGSMNPRSDSLLAATVRALSGDGMLKGLVGVLGDDKARLELFTTFRRERNPSRPTFVQLAHYRAPMPLYRGTGVEPIQPKIGPYYPERFLRTGDGGDVLVSYEVTPEGVADKRSIRILRASEPEFGHAIRNWLPTLRYVPATVGGCPVRMLVQQGHKFSIRADERVLREPE